MSTEPQAKKQKTEFGKGVLFGMGNPLLDISATVDEAFLEKYGLEPNNAILAEDKHLPMYDEMVEKYSVEFIAGGATQNSLRIAQWLIQVPEASTFMGCIGKDEYGKELEKKASEAGLKVVFQLHDTVPTGTCAVALTGTNRSLCANLAAANCFSVDHLNKEENNAYIEKAEYFYISGFPLTVCPPAIKKVASHAAENNKQFMMNLSAPFICEFFAGPMMEVMPYVDILFGNETEAVAFSKAQKFDTEDIKEIALKATTLEKSNKGRSRIVVITQGADPTIVAQDGKVTEYPVNPVKASDIVDTNGAGDAFVGGFLAKYVQKQPLDECIRCGNYAASYIIQQSGVTLNDKPSYQ